jgi:hypothetical protein
MFTKPEWAAALVKDPTGKDRKLLPVRVKKCQPDGLLTAIGYIDLVVLEEQAAKIALLEGVKLERAKPDQAPIYPGPVERIIQAAPQFPGALPPIWNIPFQRNPNFTGRDQALAELRAGLTSDDSSSWKQALWGLGGVGKSQIAVEYAYRYKDDYRVVGWLRSEEHATLAADYASLAKYLALPQKDLKDQTAIIDAVRYWLEHNHDWLLIFDNAQNPKEIKDYLPRGGGGRVVITSRNPEWGCFAQKLEIKVFKRAESIKFLLKRTGQSDRETARALAEELGCLPLALEQAGAYISKNGMALSRYLEMFQKHRKKILERGEIADYPYTVATTWEISFSNIVEKWPAGAHLLNLCAYLAPDEIPRSLLLQGANLLPEDLASAMKDEVEFEDAFSALRGYSLISNSEGSDLFSIHRLVQAVIRDKTEEDTKIRWATSALNLLNNAFAFDHDDVQTWDKCVQILPHALVAAGHARDLNIDPKLNGSLLGSIGLYLWERAEFLQAKSACCNALWRSKRKFTARNIPVWPLPSQTLELS